MFRFLQLPLRYPTSASCKSLLKRSLTQRFFQMDIFRATFYQNYVASDEIVMKFVYCFNVVEIILAFDQVSQQIQLSYPATLEHRIRYKQY